jgi:hypothetical protein
MKAKFPIPPKPYHFTASEEFWKEVDDWRRPSPICRRAPNRFGG